MMNAQSQFLGTYQLPWFYFSDVQIFFKSTRSKIELSYNFMENSDEQKSAAINEYIDAKVNVGNKGVLDAFKVRPRVALEKEAAAARAMLLRNRASTSLAGHGFISSVQPCVLASTKPLPISSAVAPFANCRKHGFASYLALEEIEQSEYYTRVEIRYPKHQIIHKYMGCELEFHEHTSRRTNMLRRAEQEALRAGYLVCTEERCKMCNKKLRGEDVYLHHEYRFCSNECRSDDMILLDFEQCMSSMKDPYPYIRRRARKKARVQFYIGDCPLAFLR